MFISTIRDIVEEHATLENRVRELHGAIHGLRGEAITDKNRGDIEKDRRIPVRILYAELKRSESLMFEYESLEVGISAENVTPEIANLLGLVQGE